MLIEDRYRSNFAPPDFELLSLHPYFPWTAEPFRMPDDVSLYLREPEMVFGQMEDEKEEAIIRFMESYGVGRTEAEKMYWETVAGGAVPAEWVVKKKSALPLYLTMGVLGLMVLLKGSHVMARGR